MNRRDLESAAWVPVVGILFMLLATKFGKYKTEHFAGWLWKPYQLISVLIFTVLVIFKNF